jgi:hypothetical protein
MANILLLLPWSRVVLLARCVCVQEQVHFGVDELLQWIWALVLLVILALQNHVVRGVYSLVTVLLLSPQLLHLTLSFLLFATLLFGLLFLPSHFLSTSLFILDSLLFASAILF